MVQSLRQVRQIRIAEFINKIVATRRFEKGRNAKKWIFGWILKIEFWISGLTWTPPAKTNSHLLLWWSWTLREGRKWPFHLICLSSQQFVKFNWNALVTEKFWTKGENNFATRELDVLPDLVMSGALQHLDHLHVDYTRWGQDFWIYNISYMHQIAFL